MKKQSSESQQSDHKTSQIKIISADHQYYLSHIKVINRQSQQFNSMLQKLKESELQYNKQFSFQFKKTIINSSRDSIKYQIEYGCFKTFISVSFAAYDLNSIRRKIIQKGRYGAIMQSLFEQQSVVAKCFFLKQFISSKLNEIIKQVFWVKFASILKIGPKFINAYGYDIICLKDSCQYLMEKCDTDQKVNQIIKHKNFGRVKNIIGILHSFQAIHGDMKLDHIAWSQKQQNLIILDFGMTKFIKEKLGQMTLTQYFGTYKYSCPDMKKAFKLKSAVLVDLFFNDLYAIQKCQNYFLEFQSIQAQKYNKFQQNEWEKIFSLFMFKFHIFNQNAQGAVKIYLKQPELIPCFRQIIKIQEQNILQKFTTQLWDILSIYKQNHRHASESNQTYSQINQIIYIQLMKSHNKPKFYQFQISLPYIKKMYQDQTLQTFLQLNEGIESIFQHIFEPKQLTEQQITQNKKTIKYIFLSKNSFSVDHNLSPQKMVKEVLLFFQDYFYKAGSLQKLKKIENIFKLTREIKYLKVVQENMCQVFFKNVDLWLDSYRKEIASFFNTIFLGDFFLPTNNIRDTWEWLTTQPQMRQRFLPQKERKFIESCANIISVIDQMVSSVKLNIEYRYNKKQLQKVLIDYEEQLMLREGNKINNFEIVIVQGIQQLSLAGAIFAHEKQIKQVQATLIYGVSNFRLSKQFSSVLASLNYILRQNIWSLAYYVKIQDFSSFQNKLQHFFEDVFVADCYKGIQIFVIFSSVFIITIKSSKKTQQIAIKFLRAIQTSKILNQIKENIHLLKNFLLHFYRIVYIFCASKLHINRSILFLEQIFSQILLFFSQNANKWINLKSDIFFLLEIDQIYFSSFKNNQWKENIGKMVELAKKVIKSNKKSLMQALAFIIYMIGYSLTISQCQEKSYQVWKMLRIVQYKEDVFYILDRNYLMFVSIIFQLCRANQFEECLYILEQYGRLAKNCKSWINPQRTTIFSQFVDNLPQNIGNQMFVNKLSIYSLTKISQSPHLSFIFYFLLVQRFRLLSKAQKMRYFKLICFGLNKITIRYENYIPVVGYLFAFYRVVLKYKSDRKQLRQLKREIRFSHDLEAQKNLAYKQHQKYHRLKIKAKIKIKDYVSKKIGRMNINIYDKNQEEQPQC